MIDVLIENIEAYLRMNDLGGMNDKLTLNYIKMSLGIYKKQAKQKTVQDMLQTRKAITTFYGGYNIND